MTGHQGWHGQGGGNRPSQSVSRTLRAAGYRVNNDRRREGLRTRSMEDEQVRVVLDYDYPSDDRPALLLEILTALAAKGYQVLDIHADPGHAYATVELPGAAKRRAGYVTRSGDGSGVD